MSKIVRLSRIAVVLSTLLVLGSMTVLPVAYADRNKPDANVFCQGQGKGYGSGWYIDDHHIQCAYNGFAAVSTSDMYWIP